VSEPKQGTDERADPPLLRVTDLVVSFRGSGLVGRGQGVSALKGVSLDVREGETVGVVGQSGSGKSTLARTIVGLEKPTSGSLEVDGRALDASAASVRSLRSTIQMVFQDSLNSLNPRLSIGATLAEPLIVHRMAPRAELKPRVLRLLDDVGLPREFISRRPMQLSGGERQRVNIARALASEPRLIIADEPTSALDVSIRSQILGLLTDLQARHGIAFIFISHDLHVVRHMSSRVIVMHHGEVVEVADKSTLYSDPAHPYTRELLRASPSTASALQRSRPPGSSVFDA
jgi:ABC-type glutathione transport system ATPase component